VYWWCIRHWGTKWNASNSKVFPRKYGADVTFDTAWAAPLPVIFKLLERYPMLAFTLHYRLEDKTRYHFFDFQKSKLQ
jgi:Ferredoxin-like domain in Api92-like protein